MAEINLMQSEADALVAMEKIRVEDRVWSFPGPGAKIIVPLISNDKRENFLLDVYRGSINLAKATYQNRARQTIILLRLDLDGSPHENPDGELVPCPHLHIYREGYGARWAIPAPADRYSKSSDLGETLTAFMSHCNIVQPPVIQMGLF